jgi:hypothetical protein
MSDIVCPNCGRGSPEGTRYCLSCGVNLGDAAPKDALGRPQYQAAKPQSLWERIKAVVRRIAM